MKKNDLYETKKTDNLKELLSDAVNLYGEKNAFIIKEKADGKIKYKNKSFKDFQNDINGLGTKLIEMGLKDKNIAIIGPNSYEWCVSYLAVLNGVGTVIPLDKSLPEEEIESLLQRSGANSIIFDEKYSESIERIKANGKTNIQFYISMKKPQNVSFLNLENLINDGKNLQNQGLNSYENCQIDNEAIRVILFTSGTTSISKAVMLSHKNIAENIYGLRKMVKIKDTDISLAFLPLHHTFGSTGFLFFMCCGATTVFCDGIRYIQQNLQEYKVTIFVCVPLLLEAMYKKIMAEAEKQGKVKKINFGKKLSRILCKCGIDIRRKLFKEILDKLGGNLRLVVSGAAAIDKEVAKSFNDFGIRTIQGYGLTETAPVLCAENDKYLRYGSVGFPLVNVEMKIVNQNEKGIGELIARGPNVAKGYYQNEEATKEVFKDGWFYTGDLGYIDKDGYVFITGRKKNVIVLKNGKNIYPEEQEILISNLPYVAENMVFGYPKNDDLIVSTKVVYNKDYIKDNYGEITEEEIKDIIWKEIKRINSGMPNYKHIKKLIITDEPMIKTTTQKIKRYEEIAKIIKEN